MQAIQLKEDVENEFEVQLSVFRNIWEVPSEYRCPVIGTCLTAEEHRRLLSKAGIKTKGVKLHVVHSILMQHLGEKNRVSTKVNQYLKQKYRRATELFGNLDEAALMDRWQQQLNAGDIDGLVYTAFSRRDLSIDLYGEIFGDIHMLSHVSVSQISKLKRDLEQQQVKHHNSQESYKQQRKINRELEQENKSLLTKLQEQNRLLAKLQSDHSSNQELKYQAQADAMPASAKSATELLESQLKAAESRLREASQTIEQLTEELANSQALNQHLQGDIEDLIAHFKTEPGFELEQEQQELPKADLDSKRVLIIGGMSKIRHLYQHLIEANGGQFEYHDGRLKNGRQMLDAKVNRSDIIICPVNCNSHNACNRVKKLCQKYKKPLKILSNASVSSISSALFKPTAEINGELLAPANGSAEFSTPLIT